MEKTRMEFADIRAGSVVFDMGGFQGNWAFDIHDRYGADVHVFEPHPVFAGEISQRFAGNAAITVYDFGLGSVQTVLTLSDDGDASSSFQVGESAVSGRLEPVSSFFESHDIARIDLMKINIEGGEYDLLPALIDAGIMPRINMVQVQFHLYAEADIERRDAIRAQLEKTHTCDWSYDFVWEQWSLRS